MKNLAPFALAGLLLPAGALAADCPFLDAGVAAQVILVKPTETPVLKEPAPPNDKGMVSSTTCRFKAQGEGIGMLSVIVMDFGSEANAKARYDGELRSQGSRARPAKIEGHPAFFTMNPGFSGGTFAQKGRYFVFVSHNFSTRVNEAIRKDPDGGPLSTHEVARRVLAKLQAAG
jgi:hypothetical protein